jgi:phosphoribosyl-ATP pyrophosphohydrolase
MVLLSNEDIKSKEILQELEKRFGLSGLDEKASRKEQ